MRGITHYDIKPENIMVTSAQKCFFVQDSVQQALSGRIKGIKMVDNKIKLVDFAFADSTPQIRGT